MTPEPDQSYDVPEEAPGEHAIVQTLIRAGVSAIPIAGGPAAELLGLIQPEIGRRTTDWLEDIAHELNRVRQRVKDLEDRDIFDDPPFVSAVISASRVAVRTHREEKREALKNALINTALRNEPDEDLQAIFLALVDQFTPWHLRILNYFNGPEAWFVREGRTPKTSTMGGAGHVLEDAFPELRGQQELYGQMVAEMAAAGLMGGGFLGTTMTWSGMIASRTTNLGQRFLRFISAPEEPKKS